MIKSYQGFQVLSLSDDLIHLLRILRGHSDSVLGLSINSSGADILSSGADSSICVSDLLPNACGGLSAKVVFFLRIGRRSVF